MYDPSSDTENAPNMYIYKYIWRERVHSVRLAYSIISPPLRAHHTPAPLFSQHAHPHALTRTRTHCCEQIALNRAPPHFHPSPYTRPHKHTHPHTHVLQASIFASDLTVCRPVPQHTPPIHSVQSPALRHGRRKCECRTCMNAHASYMNAIRSTRTHIHTHVHVYYKPTRPTRCTSLGVGVCGTGMPLR